MNIMISINRAYIEYACIMLMSLKQHHKDILLSVYILHSELTEEDFLKMDEVIGSEGIELIPVFIPEGTVKEFQIGDWPEAAAYRLLAADLFAGSLERILHLDVDTLITGDISELYNTSFDDHYLVACEQIFTTDEGRRKKCRELDRPEDTLFFNSGVCLFNIPKLAADGFYYAFYAGILTEYPNIKIEYPDQDMLNLLFCDKTKYMDKIKYNYVPYCYQISDIEHFYNSREELVANCCIIHMYGATKPWENISRMGADGLWWEYAEKTPFYCDMKAKHIQSMIHKEQKMNRIIDGKVKEINESVTSGRVLNDVEELLYQMLERGFKILERLAETT